MVGGLKCTEIYENILCQFASKMVRIVNYSPRWQPLLISLDCFWYPCPASDEDALAAGSDRIY
jgi:hypothetical protein